MARTLFLCHSATASISVSTDRTYRIDTTPVVNTASYSMSTRAGLVTPPTTATQFGELAEATKVTWISKPIANQVIFGTSNYVILNYRARETANGANATITGLVYKYQESGTYANTVISLPTGLTELSTSMANYNRTASGSGVVTFEANTRIAVQLFQDDASTNTMSAGRQVYLEIGHTTAHTSITLSQDFIFIDEVKTLTTTTDAYTAAAPSAVEKTSTTDAYLLKVDTKTHTTDSALFGSLTKPHTTDSNLYQVQTKTNSCDSYLYKTETKTHTADSLLFTQQTKTHTADAYTLLPVTKTHTADALALGTIEKAHTSDAYLQSAQTVTLTHTIDAALFGAVTVTHTTDSELTSDKFLSHTVDSALVLTQTIDHTADALIIADLTVQPLESDLAGDMLAGDIAFKAAKTKSHATSSYLGIYYPYQREKTFSTDSRLGRTIITYSTDAVVATLNTQSHQTNSYIAYFLPYQRTLTTSTDGLMQLAPERAHTSDSLLQKVGEPTHTTDSHAVNRIEATHTADSYLFSDIRRHSSDALLLKTSELTSTTDAVLNDVYVRELTHTADALLRSGGTVWTGKTKTSGIWTPVYRDQHEAG